MKRCRMSLCMVLVAVFMLSTQVSAASGINASEQQILDALNQSITTKAGASLKLPGQYTNQATTYLQRDGVDLTEAEAKEIIAKINQVVALVADTDATKWSEVPADVAEKAAKLAQEAASMIGLTLTFDATTKTLTIKDTSNTTVLETGKVVKQTGSSLNIVWIGCLLAVSLLATAVVALKKTKVFSVEDKEYAL